MNYKYVITGDGYKAKVFHSDLPWLEFKKYIGYNTKKVHPKCNDTVYRWGSIEFFNPKVMCLEDFADFGPALV